MWKENGHTWRFLAVLYLILFIFVLAGGTLALLAAQNFSTDVQLKLFAWQTAHMPLGLVIAAAFLLGALLFYIVSVLSAVSDRRELKKLRKRIDELERTSLSPRLPSGPLQVAPSQVPPIVPMPGIQPPASQN